MLLPQTLRMRSGVDAPDEEDFAGDRPIAPAEEGDSLGWLIVRLVDADVGVDVELNRDKGNLVYGDFSSPVESPWGDRDESFKSSDFFSGDLCLPLSPVVVE